MPEFSKGNQNPLGFIEFIVGKKKKNPYEYKQCGKTF